MAFRTSDPQLIEWDDIEFSLDGGAAKGRILDPGFAGLGTRRVSMPALLAHRPQASRFFRLARIVGAARAIARTELGLQGPALLSAALVSIEDCKGDFRAVWRESDHRLAFESMISRAVALEGENPGDQLVHGGEVP